MKKIIRLTENELHSIISEETDMVVNPRKYYDRNKYEINGHYYSGYSTIFDLDNGKSNFIDENGNTLSDVWFDDVDSFDDSVDIAIVKLNGKYNYIASDGRILLPFWVNVAHDFDMLFDEEGNLITYYAEIEYRGKNFYIDRNGKEIRFNGN